MDCFLLRRFSKKYNHMEKTFTRVRSVGDIVTVSSFIVLGTVLIALPTSTAVNFSGFLMICTGMILSFILKTGYKDTQTGDTYKKKERYFQHAMNEHIAKAIATKPDSVDLSEEDKGNSMRLDIYYSKSTNLAYIQLHEYVPYAYEPCSKMYEYELSKVGKLIG